MAHTSKPARVAILAAYRKDDTLADFARRLAAMRWQLLGSHGTADFLRNKKGIPCRDIAEIVGPPILGHRVVTLAREVYAGILARLDKAEDVEELARIGVHAINLVYVDLYPLAEELANPKRTYRSVKEKIDVGGPTLLCAAAKGNRLVLSHPEQFKPVLGVLKGAFGSRPSSAFEIRFLARLAADATQRAGDHIRLAEGFYRQVADGAWDRVEPDFYQNPT